MAIEKHWAIEASEAEGLLAEQHARLTLRGVGINEQVKQLKKETNLEVTRTKLINLKRHPKYHEVIQKDAEAKIKNGQLTAMLGIAELVPDAIAALARLVKADNVKAVDTAIRLGIGKEEEKTEQKQAIQILLATDKSEKPV